MSRRLFRVLNESNALEELVDNGSEVLTLEEMISDLSGTKEASLRNNCAWFCRLTSPVQLSV